MKLKPLVKMTLKTLYVYSDPDIVTSSLEILTLEISINLGTLIRRMM